jgi:hypothetical protein
LTGGGAASGGVTCEVAAGEGVTGGWAVIGDVSGGGVASRRVTGGAAASGGVTCGGAASRGQWGHDRWRRWRRWRGWTPTAWLSPCASAWIEVIDRRAR